MKFTIDADCELARAITERTSAGYQFTLTIHAHDNTFTDVDRLTAARIVGWTVRAGCDHPGCSGCKRVMDVEWLDPDEQFKQFGWPYHLLQPKATGKEN